MTPSSAHGVTTAVMGNCGVGFAPCRAEDHETLVDVMAGVEDIPGVVMVDGLPWTWETFPEFLDALDSRSRDIDVAAFLPHSPLRVYVMGQRGVDREPATDEDLALMRKLADRGGRGRCAGLRVVALDPAQVPKVVEPIPSFEAGHAEIEAIARGVKDAGGGLIQFVPDLVAGDYGPALQTVFDVAEDVGLPVTFTLAIGNAGDPFFADGLNMVEKANAAGGDITAQVFPRPIGLVIGLELSGNPFVMYPELPGDRPPAVGRARRRDAQTRSARTHPGRSPVRRGPPADVRRAGVRVDVPTGRPAELRARRVRRASPAAPGPVGSARRRRPTTGCSTTTGTPCCSSRSPTSETVRWTPWQS